VSRASGLTEAELAALPRYRDSELFGALDRLVLDLAVAMSETPAEVPDDLRHALLAHLTPGQLAELAATVAWENHRARLNRALGVRPVGFSDGHYCALPEDRTDAPPFPLGGLEPGHAGGDGGPAEGAARVRGGRSSP
jgi:hypothetical protein